MLPKNQSDLGAIVALHMLVFVIFRSVAHFNKNHSKNPAFTRKTHGVRISLLYANEVFDRFLDFLMHERFMISDF